MVVAKGSLGGGGRGGRRAKDGTKGGAKPGRNERAGKAETGAGAARARPGRAAKRGEPAEKSPAELIYERLILYIQDFEDQLDEAHEIALGFAGGAAGVLRIEGLGFFAPDLLSFYGIDDEGARMQLIQHVTQLNVVLVAAPKEKDDRPPQRIGFRLAADLDKSGRGKPTP